MLQEECCSSVKPPFDSFGIDQNLLFDVHPTGSGALDICMISPGAIESLLRDKPL